MGDGTAQDPTAQELKTPAKAIDPAQAARDARFAEMREAHLDQLEMGGKVRTVLRWWGYVGVLLLSAGLFWAMRGEDPTIAQWVVFGAPALALATLLVVLAVFEARAFGGLMSWLEAKPEGEREPYLSIAANALPQVEISRSQNLANGAVLVVMTAYAVGEFFETGTSAVASFYGYLFGYFLVAAIVIGFSQWAAKQTAPKWVTGLAGLTPLFVVIGAVVVFYFGQIWSTGADIGFPRFVGRVLAALALFGLASFLLRHLGRRAAKITKRAVEAAGFYQFRILPDTAHERLKLLLHKAEGQGVVLFMAATAYSPVLMLAAQPLSPIAVFAVGFIAFAGLFFAAVVVRSSEVRPEQFGVLAQILMMIMIGIALNFALAFVVGYGLGTVILLAYQALFDDLGALIFPDVLLLAYSTPFLEIPFLSAGLGILLAAAALVPISFLLYVTTDFIGNGLRLMVLVVVVAAIFLAGTAVDQFGLALPDAYVAPIAEFFDVSIGVVNRAIIVALIYLAAELARAWLTKPFYCTNEACKAPAPYQHVRRCWRCGEALNFPDRRRDRRAAARAG